MNDVAVVVGVGPGLGESIVRRFARENFSVAMLARSEEKLDRLEREAMDGLSLTGFACDATEADEVDQTLASIRDQLGAPSVLIYNAGAYQPGEVREIDPERFRECWEANCYGGYLTARAVLPDMLEQGEGTILFTGATASLRGSAGFSALAVGKFGLRALSQSLAREHGPDGIHVAHVIVDGQILTPDARERFPDREDRTFLDPDEIAHTYWTLHTQHHSAWTQELDLRPHVESF